MTYHDPQSAEVNHASISDIIICNKKKREKLATNVISLEYNAWNYVSLERLKQSNLYFVKCKNCLEIIHEKRKPLKITESITI